MLEDFLFPNPRYAPEDGLLAIGGDFQPVRLVAAYAQGIFPWPSPGLPYAWFSPDPRALLIPEELRVPRRLRRKMRQEPFLLTWDTAFERVIRECASAPRPGQYGTWITEELLQGYVGLHELGVAHSIEAWQGDRLVGGLYGVSLGGMFSGESMFYREPDASKIVLVTLIERLRDWNFRFFDCQVMTPHAERFGARDWPREAFLDALARALEQPTRRGRWTSEPG